MSKPPITFFLCLSFVLITYTATFAQSIRSGPESQEMTRDQIEIYRTVIANYFGNSSGKLNIRSTTEVSDEEHPFYDD